MASEEIIRKAIKDLSQIDEVLDNHFLIVETNDGTTIIKLENFVLGKGNVSFAQQIDDNTDTLNSTITTNISSVSLVTDLSATKPTTSKIVYVKGYTSEFDGAEGLFKWNSGSNSSNNFGTVLEPVSADSTGRWERIIVDSINPKWFGAKGDNSTDDTIAIYNSLTAANNTYPLRFPQGTYLTDKQEIYSNTIIYGENATIKLNSSVDTSLFSISGRNDLLLSGLTIDGNSSTSASPVIDILDSSNVIIEKSKIINGSGIGIRANNTTYFKLIGSNVTDNGTIGVVLSGNTSTLSKYNLLTNNIFTNNAIDIVESGVSNTNLVASNILTNSLIVSGNNSINDVLNRQRYDSTFTTMQENSGVWQETYTTVNVNSGGW